MSERDNGRAGNHSMYNDLTTSSEVVGARSDAAGGAREGQGMESYNELTRLLERLHRRHLDVVRIDLAAEGIEDVTPAQAMLLMDIGEAEISIRDLIERGYYLASTATYNIRKLAELGYVDQTRSPSDRRQVRLKLTDRGLDLVARVRAGHPQVANAEGEDSDAWRDRLAEAARTLRELERAWFDYVSFK